MYICIIFSSDLFMRNRSCDSRNHEVDWGKKYICLPVSYVRVRTFLQKWLKKNWLKEIYLKYVKFFNITEDKYPNTITVYCRFLVNHIVWNKWREIAFNYWKEKKKHATISIFSSTSSSYPDSLPIKLPSFAAIY